MLQALSAPSARVTTNREQIIYITAIGHGHTIAITCSVQQVYFMCADPSVINK